MAVTYLCAKTVNFPNWIFDLRRHRSVADEHCLMRVFQRAVNPLSPPAVSPSGNRFFDRVLEMQTRILPAIIPDDLAEILRYLQTPQAETVQLPETQPAQQSPREWKIV